MQRLAELGVDATNVLGPFRPELETVDDEDCVAEHRDGVSCVVFESGGPPPTVGIVVDRPVPDPDRGPSQIHGRRREKAWTAKAKLVGKSGECEQVQDDRAEGGMVVLARSRRTGSAGPQKEVDEVVWRHMVKAEGEFPAHSLLEGAEFVALEGLVGDPDVVLDRRGVAVLELGGDPCARAGGGEREWREGVGCESIIGPSLE